MLAIAGCVRGTGEKGLTHDDVAAINERVLEKAIGQPDSALIMIEGLRAPHVKKYRFVCSFKVFCVILHLILGSM